MSKQNYLITGGGSGIGKAAALNLAAQGYSVAVMGRRKELLDEVIQEIEQAGGKGLACVADVRDSEQVAQQVDLVAKEFGGIKGVVNSAAGNFVTPAEKLSPNGWRAVIDIVLNGTWNVTSAAVKHMIEQEYGGSFVNVIASYAWTGHPGTVHSAAGKAGVLAMSKTLAVEWAKYGIRVNCIAPGPTETAGAGAALWASAEERERVLSSVPLSRFASAEEVGELIGFLLSEKAGYITGETLTADGGQSLGKQVYGEPVTD